MSTLSQFTGSGIKSIQRGLIVMTSGETTKNATITAVDVNKSVLTNLGNSEGFDGRLTLAGSTTVNANKSYTTSGLTIAFQVVEYY